MKSAVVLSQREEQILQAVNTYRFLTASQVCRLFFSETSQNYAGKLLKHLSDIKYLVRFPLPSTARGNRELLYTLGRPGIQFLKSIGCDMQYWNKHSAVSLSYLHTQHSLCVNDVLIAASLLEKRVQGVTLRTLRHEWTLKHTPLLVPLGDREVGIVPDGFLDFRLLIKGASYQTGVWLEVDKGTEGPDIIRRKVRALHTVMIRELYKDYLHTGSLTVAFATTAGDARLKTMRVWVEEELQVLRGVDRKEFFLLTTLPPGPDPLTFFLRPVWEMPFVKPLQPLLDLS